MGSPRANVQALLPTARMSSHLASPCLNSALPSALLQACRACRSRSRLQLHGSSDAPAPASDRCRWQDPVSGKPAQKDSSGRAGSRRMAAPSCTRSTIQSVERVFSSASIWLPPGLPFPRAFAAHVGDRRFSQCHLPLPPAFPSERPGDHALDLLSVPWCDTAACPHCPHHICGYPQGTASSSHHLVGCW